MTMDPLRNLSRSVRPNSSGRARRRRFVPRLETLEDRVQPSNFKSLDAMGARGAHAAAGHGRNQPATVIVDEVEPPNASGQNDTAQTAQFVQQLGTGPGDVAAIDVAGALSPAPSAVSSHEDDGSIARANPTGLVAGQSGRVTASAMIGDGPNGSQGTRTGDYDFYRVPALANQLITVNVDIAGSSLNSVVAIYNSSGTQLALNDDKFDNPYFGFSRSSYLRFLVPANDIYYVAVFGSGGGTASEGPYNLNITLASPFIVHPAEDDGAIPLAEPTGLTLGPGGLAYVSATIGDGPHGSSGTGTGDFDFYSVPAAAGQTIRVDVDGTDPNVPGGGLDTVAGICNSAGQWLASNDDDLETRNSFISFVAPANDTYYVVIGGYSYTAAHLLPTNRFDPASGSGAGIEGAYTLTIQVLPSAPPDVDYYSFDLAAGDVFGANVVGNAGQLQLYQPDGTLLVGSMQDAGASFPQSSPLPRGGHASLGYVVSTPGRYTLAVVGGETLDVLGVGTYTLQLRDYRPALEQQPVYSHQILYLDFDGAEINAAQLLQASFGSGGNPDAHLSPLASFLPEWRLNANDENAVIDSVVAQVTANIAQQVSGVVGHGRNGDFTITGRAGEFQLEILNSRDIPDPFGVYPNVSRVIIGGSWAELGAPYEIVGIAQSIDVGNFDTSETAVVLLDSLGDADPSGGRLNLNAIPRAPGVTMIDLIGAMVGSIAAHEFGHLSGNFHTDPVLDPDDTMNPYAGLPRGPDGIFGTADDDPRHFGVGHFWADQGPYYAGVNDTLNTIAFGLSTGKQAGTYFDFVTGTLYVTGSIDDGRKDDLQVKTAGANIQVFINGQLSLTRPAAGVTRVGLNGSSDDDTLEASDYGGSAILLGRGGKDVLTGGSGNDVLVGGDGDDQLTAGSGRAVIIGGNGVDHLMGGSGGDMLIGGPTGFDANVTALSAVSAEWSSNRTYETRVTNLRGTGIGPRANANYFLTAAGTAATVLDDDDVDILTGGSGHDWYFARRSGAKRDQILGLADDEFVDDL
jgi:hypothetical protein